MAGPNKAERLTKLVAALLDVAQPLPLRQIVREVEGYPAAYESARVQFYRDRDLLKAEGIEIVTIGDGDPEGDRYRIDPASYYLPDLGLTDDEAVALNLAASRVRLDGHDPDEALLKLNGFGADGPVTVALPSHDRLPVIWSALRSHAVITFTYNGIEREVAPYGVLCRDGFWYVAGDDRTKVGRKNFRVDRIEGDVQVGDGGAFEIPSDFSLADALPEEPFELSGDEPVDVDVWLDRVMAPRYDEDAIDRAPDGSVVVRLRVSNRAGFRSWLFGMRDHARVVAPTEVVDDVRSWLRAMVDAG